jgi:carnitine-CoA ligase
VTEPPIGVEFRELVVTEALLRRIPEHADDPFIRFGEDVATYGQVHHRARAAAAALDAVGVDRGQLVGLLAPNSISYVELYFGIALRGAAVVLVNTSFTGYMLEYVLNDAACRVLVVHEGLLAPLLESEDALQHLETLVVTGDGAKVAGWAQRFAKLSVVSMAELETRSVPAHRAVVAVSPNDLHCIVYSSGTTGPSKGVMISHAHALTKAAEVLRICGFTSDDVLYSPLPLFYSMGLLRGVLSVALVGSSIVLRDKFSVGAFWDDVRRHGATVAHCVFSIPKMLKTAPAREDDADNPLRCMFNAQHDPAFEQRFSVRLIESYGLTEAGNAIYNRLGEPVVPGSCGRVADDWEVRLADPDGFEVPVGETGEILLRPHAPGCVMLGYLNKPEATAAAMRDLWLHTGDLARRDASGHFFYQGRNKDMIRRRGQNISAWEVEEILRSCPGIADVAAVAQPSELGEDELRVVLVAHESVASIDLGAVAEFCARRMPAFMVPRYYEVAAALPKTPSGRTEKYRLAGVDAVQRFDREAERR